MARQPTTLRVVAHSDLRILDPIGTTAFIVRTHGWMIWDTPFALAGDLDIVETPQHDLHPPLKKDRVVSPVPVFWNIEKKQAVPSRLFRSAVAGQTTASPTICVRCRRRWNGPASWMARCLVHRLSQKAIEPASQRKRQVNSGR